MPAKYTRGVQNFVLKMFSYLKVFRGKKQRTNACAFIDYFCQAWLWSVRKGARHAMHRLLCVPDMACRSASQVKIIHLSPREGEGGVGGVSAAWTAYPWSTEKR